MSDLMIFKNEEFGEIRSLEIDNEPYFIGNEIAMILGYKNTRDAISKHVDEEDKLSDVAFRDGVPERDVVRVQHLPLFLNCARAIAAQHGRNDAPEAVLRVAIEKHGLARFDRRERA